MFEIGLGQYLSLGAIIFTFGLIGIMGTSFIGLTRSLMI